MSEHQCNDCGNAWDCNAQVPRCSQCKSYDVQEIEDGSEDGDGSSTVEREDVKRSTIEDNDDEVLEEQREEDDGEDEDGDGINFSVEDLNDAANDRDDFEWDSTSDDSTSDDGTSDGFSEGIEVDEEQIKIIWSVTFDLIASRRGEHWELKDNESEKLAGAWTPVINEMAPQAVRENSVLAAAVITTIVVVGPRVREDKKKREEQQEEQQQYQEREDDDLNVNVETETLSEKLDEDGDENSEEIKTAYDKI